MGQLQKLVEKLNEKRKQYEQRVNVGEDKQESETLRIINDIIVNRVNFVDPRSNFNASKIHEDLNFSKDLHMDDLDFTELIMDIERKWGVRFSDEVVDRVYTVADLYKLVKSIKKE